MKCINCGKENAPEETFCDDCGFPLEEAGQPETTPQVPLPAGEVQCPSPECGKINPPGTAFCTECGADLSEQVGAIPAPVTPPAAGAKLISPDNSEIALAEGTRVIGRGDFDRTLAGEDLKYISRQHLSITFEDSEYFVEDRDSANGTNLNGVEIKGKGKQMLQDGDRIEVAAVVTLTFKLS